MNLQINFDFKLINKFNFFLNLFQINKPNEDQFDSLYSKKRSFFRKLIYFFFKCISNFVRTSKLKLLTVRITGRTFEFSLF